MQWLLSLWFCVTAVSALAFRAPSVADDLRAVVSPDCSVSVSVDLRARWSDYNAPTPAIIVNVTSERDVAAVVRSSSYAELTSFLTISFVL